MKLIDETYEKIKWLQYTVDREKKSDLPKTEFTKRLIAEDKQKIKVLKMFLTELHKLSYKGQKTISQKKVRKILKDIIYRKLHMIKSPFKDV